LFADYSTGVIAWCFLALTLGGFIKGALGVGTPLLTVPMMALVLPPQMAVAIMAIPVVIANLWQFVQGGRPREAVRRFWPAFVAILVGTWVGVNILASLDDRALLILVGAAVIVFAIMQGSRFRLQLPDALIKPAGLFFGGASGLIGGISSFFGPMLITYLISVRDIDKDQFVGSISFLYVSAVVPWTVMLYVYEILDGPVLAYSLFATIPVTLGLMIGQRIRRFISDARFRYLILGILLVSGISMLWRAYH